MFEIRDLVKRSVAKSITFRLLVIAADTVVVYLLTHRYDTTLGVIVFTNFASTILYFIHERIWTKINWGKVKQMVDIKGV